MLSDDSSEKYLITLERRFIGSKENFLLIMKTLYQLNLISNKKDEREECKSIINILESFDFLVLVTFFSSLFEIINPVSTALQHENNDLQKYKYLMNMSDTESEYIENIPESASEELPIDLSRKIIVAILEEATNQLFILKRIGEWPDIDAAVRYDIEEKSKDDLEKKCSFIVERIELLFKEVTENGRYDDFADMLHIFHQMQQDEEDLIANMKYNESRVAQLQEFLEREMTALSGQVSEYMQKIGCIKDDIEESSDFISEADMKIRYVTHLKNTEQGMKDKFFLDKQNEMLQDIKTTEGNIMKEIRVHEETITYFNLIQKELEDDLNSWKLRYTKTINCLNKKIKEETDKVDSKIAEINRMKRLQEEKRLLKKKLDEAATKIQAWWRGTMVRKGFGKYRKRKDKKGKKNKNKNISKYISLFLPRAVNCTVSHGVPMCRSNVCCSLVLSTLIQVLPYLKVNKYLDNNHLQMYILEKIYEIIQHCYISSKVGSQLRNGELIRKKRQADVSNVESRPEAKGFVNHKNSKRNNNDENLDPDFKPHCNVTSPKSKKITKIEIKSHYKIHTLRSSSSSITDMFQNESIPGNSALDRSVNYINDTTSEGWAHVQTSAAPLDICLSSSNSDDESLLLDENREENSLFIVSPIIEDLIDLTLDEVLNMFTKKDTITKRRKSDTSLSEVIAKKAKKKVVMLPRLKTFKEVIFTQRIIGLNQ
nr:unnamed protein product [Callosobruchus analis]